MKRTSIMFSSVMLVHFTLNSCNIKDKQSSSTSLSELNDDYKLVKENIESEIKFLSSNSNFDNFKDSESGIFIECLVFNNLANKISYWEEIDNKEIKRLLKTLRKLVKKNQKIELPKIRKKYAQIAEVKLWGAKVEVHSNGSKDRIINFTNEMFLRKENREKLQDEVYEMVTNLRFTEARFRPKIEDSQYSTWDIKSPKDSKIVEIDIKE